MSQSQETAVLPAAWLASAALLGGRFWHWWRSELVATLPKALRSRFMRKPDLLVTKVGDAWQLVEIASPGKAPPRSAGVKASDIFVRKIELPAASYLRLRSAIELLLGRLTPFAATDARWNCRFAGVSSDGRLEVDVAAMRKADAEQIEAEIAARYPSVERLCVVEEQSEHPTRPAFELMRFDNAAAHTRSLVRLSAAAFAVIAWTLVFVALDDSRAREVASLDAQIAAMRGRAERTVEARHALARILRPIEVARAAWAHPKIGLLAELSSVLPADAHLVELRVDGTAVTLIGFAKSAPDLIDRLERSSALKNVRFRAPVNRRADQSIERFEISADLEGVAP